MFAALAVVLLAAGSIFPLATFCAPALAGLCAVPVAVEFGLKAGLAVYIITGVLALFFCPDLEAVCIFLFLLGYYPLLKPWLDRAARPVARVLAKLAVCNLSVLACYGLLLFVFPLPALQAEMGEMGLLAAGGMLVGTLVGIFLVPGLYMLFEALETKMKRKKHNDSKKNETQPNLV